VQVQFGADAFRAHSLRIAHSWSCVRLSLTRKHPAGGALEYLSSFVDPMSAEISALDDATKTSSGIRSPPVLVQRLDLDREFGVWIEHDQVGIVPRLNRSLAIEAGETGWNSAHPIGQLIERILAGRRARPRGGQAELE
jgi:hypothetical protein